MYRPIENLLSALDLTDTGARTDEDIFTGPSMWMPIGRVFGGQVLAQSVVAATRTIRPGRIVHSAHAYFLRPGDVEHSITFSVDRLHDGRSFSTRRTHAYQNGVPILSVILSFQDVNDGLDHQSDRPEGIPEPEELPADGDALIGTDHPLAHYWTTDRPFELRHFPSPVYLSVEGERVARQAVWLRAKERLPDDENLHRALLAYASDYTILESIYRRHGVAWSTPGLKAASLDHAIWWHRFGRVDEWMLYVQESPSAIGGRGLSLGRIYSRGGSLLASIAQEGMVRVPSGGAD